MPQVLRQPRWVCKRHNPESGPALPASCYEIPTRIHSSRLSAEIGGVPYEWFGGFGAIIKSRELGVKVGDVRMIGGIPFYAYIVHRPGRWWSKPEVSWTIPNDRLDPEWIQAFKFVMFS